MRSSIAFATAALSTLALAQNNTVQFFAPGGGEGVDLVASVVTANPSTTILDFTCPTDADSNDCGWGPGLTYSIISTTSLAATMSEDDFTLAFSCAHNTAESTMSCGISQAGGNDPTVTSTVFSGSEIAFLTATITAGAEKLAAQTGSAASSGSSGSSGMATSTSASGTGASAAGKPSGAANATGSAAPEQSTGAAFRYGVEGSALLALAGAAALNAW